eukprot:gb/GEZN01007914.1/.p1 GENE.gb/GEZN01007914.1/~~gb/GEZN01007914.1/.p1  ORF type:complete len:411 (+),score=98.25 gb/GEZN01007914.1/:22-1254(+)
MSVSINKGEGGKKKKKKKVKKGAALASDSKEGSELSNDNNIEAMLEQAETLLAGCQAAQAIPVLQKVLQLAPKDTAALDLLAQALLAEDRREHAIQALKQSISLAPAENHTKWMLLGQLTEGRYALKAFQQGCKVASEQRQKLTEAFPYGDTEDQKEFKLAMDDLALELSRGYTAMGELYTTDLCDEQEAESECNRLLALAIQTCPANPEAHAATASLRLIQSRQADALAATKQSVQALQQAELDASAIDVSHEAKLNIAKLCFELKQFDDAVVLFEKLLEENDSQEEVWYLTGASYAHLKKPRTAVKYLTRAAEMLRKSPEADQDIKKKVAAALSQARAVIKTGGPSEDSDSEDEQKTTDNAGDDSDEDEAMADSEVAYGASSSSRTSGLQTASPEEVATEEEDQEMMQ